MQNKAHELLHELFNSINQFYDFFGVRTMTEDEAKSEPGDKYCQVYFRVKEYLDEANSKANQGD